MITMYYGKNLKFTVLWLKILVINIFFYHNLSWAPLASPFDWTKDLDFTEIANVWVDSELGYSSETFHLMRYVRFMLRGLKTGKSSVYYNYQF